MIYPKTFEAKLKFEKIRELLCLHCLSSLGKENVERMTFSTQFDEVHAWLEQTQELLRIEADGDEMPASYFIDLRQCLKKIRVEGLFLEEHELFDLMRSLGTVRDIIRFIKNRNSDEYPRLYDLASPVMIYPAVIERIDSVLNKQGVIKDNATPELSHLRRDIIVKQQSVTRRMASILKQAQHDGLVDSGVEVCMRDGRAVIPVLSSNKRKLPGIVHDESATGRTTYIEPAEIVGLNNEIRELIYAERREVTKILTAVSSFLRPYLDDLLYAYEFLGTVDFIRAKAHFAVRLNAIVPELGQTPAMRWIEARHPLLYLQHKAQGKTVMPMDIDFLPKQRIILISGPNAGGKSVCLQTVGLLQYMLQCGLPVPVREGSQMGFFNSILLDLGDEQSIENDLSTYSSHLTNMKMFIRHSDNHSLLLIDEFGTGTEPALGGAIAESVLEQLNRQGVYGVITTHYTNLKHFAAETEGIVNGAMLFDTHNIQPLFKLQTGQPGSSFAFEIARKIGLPENVLAAAQERLGDDRINFDKHLREIIRDKHYWERKRNQVKEQGQRLETVSKKYEDELQQLTRERKEILKKAREEAGALVERANKEIESTIRQIREAQAEKEKTREVRKKLNDFKEDVVGDDSADDATQLRLNKRMDAIRDRQSRKKTGADKKNTQKSAHDKPEPAIDAIIEGDWVKLHGQPVPGEVMEVRGNEALVVFGRLITNVKIIRLEKISHNEAKKEARRQNSTTSALSERIRKKKLDFTPDIDIRGMRADEAVERVITHIDEAVMCDASQVKILHGKGNGILRQMIREQLNILPFVKRFGDEHVQFGGAGITVVELE
ncbi:MAG: Smr/MutS family protein [Cytophagaceae bacterium]|jgi:DNA mismatch repair protein MutS2|nr:Smr/MutS family protein [Cytophagaceae bacterium]